jgi:hypothetical protein
MSDPLLQLVDWNKHFENNKSRERDRCGFVCVPNKFGGVGLTNVLDHPEGAAIYGIWVLILELCSKQHRPRDGWLTDNGRPDGRPLGPEQLARLFRRSQTEIKLCFEVVSNIEVGWIWLVSGEADWLGAGTRLAPEDWLQQCAGTPEAPQCPPKGTALPAPSEKPDSKQPGTAVPAEGHRSALEGKERNEGKGNTRTEDVVQHAGAKLRLGALAERVFGQKLGNFWPSDLEHWLDEALPMKEEDLNLLDWFYDLPADHEAFAITRRRQSFPKLIEHIKEELQKIRQVRKHFGLNGAKAIETLKEDWTETRKEAAVILWGPEKKMPPHFRDLPTSAQREVDEKAKTIR